jgi:RNA polymerase sigma factor (sigma-70 family)
MAAEIPNGRHHMVNLYASLAAALCPREPGPWQIRFALAAVYLLVRRGRGRDEEELSDEALLSGMAIGDENAGLVFVRRFQHRLFGLATTIVGDPGLAEDIAQEAFVRIFGHAVMFDSRRGSVATWTLTITRNLAIDALRVRRGVPTDPDAQVFAKLMSDERVPEDAAITADALVRAQDALAGLPIDQRRAALLAAMYGWTAAQIAEAEAIPLGTAKSRIRLGMAKLRESAAIGEAS